MKSNLGIAVVVMALLAATVATYTPAQETNPPPRIYVYSGILRSIDRPARIITVERSAVSLRFVVPADARIIVKDNSHARLGDLLIGDALEVQYTVEEGINVAHQISPLGLITP